MQRDESFKKTLMLGKIESRQKREQQRMRLLDGITDSMDMGLGGLRGLGMDRENLACSDSLEKTLMLGKIEGRRRRGRRQRLRWMASPTQWT